MKKKVFRHILFWLLIITSDVIGYLKLWNHKATISTISGYSWLIFTFYACYFIAQKILKKRNDLVDIDRKNKVVLITSLSFFYVVICYCFDRHVVYNYFGPTFWAYCTMRLWIILPVLFGIISQLVNEKGNVHIAWAKKEQERLLQENEMIKAEKEKMQLGMEVLAKEKEVIQQEKKILLNEKTFLEVQIIAGEEYLAEIHRQYEQKQREFQALLNRLGGQENKDNDA